MGYPLDPVLANLFMVQYEKRWLVQYEGPVNTPTSSLRWRGRSIKNFPSLMYSQTTVTLHFLSPTLVFFLTFTAFYRYLKHWV